MLQSLTLLYFLVTRNIALYAHNPIYLATCVCVSLRVVFVVLTSLRGTADFGGLRTEVLIGVEAPVEGLEKSPRI